MRLKQSARKNTSGSGKVRFDTNRFLNAENSHWYDQNCTKEVIIEKSILPAIEPEIPVRAEFDKFGWGPMLDIKGQYYPKLVWQFYANMEAKSDVSLGAIRTFVKGKHIEVTAASLSTLLGIPNVGPPVTYTHSAGFTSDPSYSLPKGIRNLSYSRYRRPKRCPYLLLQMPMLDRIISYFISGNVVPRKSGSSEIRHIDIYLIDKLLNGLGAIEGIPLSSIMISHMRSIAKKANDSHKAPFPVIISRILAAAGVELGDEMVQITDTKDVLHSGAMIGMGFFLRNGLWYKNREAKGSICHGRDLRPPPSEVDETAPPPVASQRRVRPRVSTSQGESSSHTRPSRRSRRDKALFDFLDELKGAVDRMGTALHQMGGPPPVPITPVDRTALDASSDSASTTDSDSDSGAL